MQQTRLDIISEHTLATLHCHTVQCCHEHQCAMVWLHLDKALVEKVILNVCDTHIVAKDLVLSVVTIVYTD